MTQLFIALAGLAAISGELSAYNVLMLAAVGGGLSAYNILTAARAAA